MIGHFKPSLVIMEDRITKIDSIDLSSYKRCKELETIVSQLKTVEAFNSRSDCKINRVFFSLTENTKSSSSTLLQKVAPMLKKLHWRPVRCRIIYKFFLLVYKVLSGALPSCVRDLINFSLLLTFFMYVKIIFSGFWRLQKIHWGERAGTAPRQWNSIPCNITPVYTGNSINISKRIFKFCCISGAA